MPERQKIHITLGENENGRLDCRIEFFPVLGTNKSDEGMALAYVAHLLANNVENALNAIRASETNLPTTVKG